MNEAIPPRGIPMHQISEADLAELERMLPEITSRLWGEIDNRLRVQMRRVKSILSDVRWNYGPPLEIETLPGATA